MFDNQCLAMCGAGFVSVFSGVVAVLLLQRERRLNTSKVLLNAVIFNASYP